MPSSGLPSSSSWGSPVHLQFIMGWGGINNKQNYNNSRKVEVTFRTRWRHPAANTDSCDRIDSGPARSDPGWSLEMKGLQYSKGLGPGASQRDIPIPQAPALPHFQILPCGVCVCGVCSRARQELVPGFPVGLCPPLLGAHSPPRLLKPAGKDGAVNWLVSRICRRQDD